jgi:hypothetical protein
MAKQRRSRIATQFTYRLVELQESPAYRVLSLSGHRALSRIEIELRHHGGRDNGALPVTFDDFEAYGISRHSIGPALAELEALGLIVITEHGVMAKAAEYRRTNKFRLTTSPELEGVGPHGCYWRRFKTLEEAFAAAEAARTNSAEKKKPPVQKVHCRPVKKVHCKGEKASAESAPLWMAKIASLSISRVGSTPPGLAPPPVDDAPAPAPDQRVTRQKARVRSRGARAAR